jgi:hypothetical protein
MSQSTLTGVTSRMNAFLGDCVNQLKHNAKKKTFANAESEEQAPNRKAVNLICVDQLAIHDTLWQRALSKESERQSKQPERKTVLTLNKLEFGWTLNDCPLIEALARSHT